MYKRIDFTIEDPNYTFQYIFIKYAYLIFSSSTIFLLVVSGSSTSMTRSSDPLWFGSSTGKVADENDSS